MRRQQNFLNTMVLGLAAGVNKAYGAISKLSVSTPFLTHKSEGQIKINYNHTDYPITPTECATINDVFYVDRLGNPHNGSSSESLYTNILDSFLWSADRINGAIKTTVGLFKMAGECIVNTTSSHAEYYLQCDTTQDKNMAVIYNSALPFRRGFVEFNVTANNAIFCKTEGNGFMVTTYDSQPINPDVHTNDDKFNLYYLIPIVGGSLLLMGAAAYLCYRSKTNNKHALLSEFPRAENDSDSLTVELTEGYNSLEASTT